ncbi:hypothetical protein HMPREF1526_02583 [Butyricicoccus pullicaecorum 1.2]|uniref:Uncharacterized protein n=1 Tax=Butyricicoccus pullicaecorum 1.2 TaxID=1203606 RepID=R8VU03_9FIRM|nr:hypothetical protein HMPREF1526_02583 [Butyricicoccus pullicaecorum 1.2]
MKFARFLNSLAQAQLTCYAPGVSIYDRYRPRTK